MNKKQMGIILTLLVLIACAGILSAMMNGKVDDPAGSIPSALSFNKENTTKETTDKTTDYFFEAKSIKEQQDAKTKEAMKTIMNDKNSTPKAKEDAAKSIKDLDMAQNYATKIELGVRAKGFDEAVCLIEGKKARVIVKSKEALTDKQNIQIQEVVLNVSKLKDVIIETK